MIAIVIIALMLLTLVTAFNDALLDIGKISKSNKVIVLILQIIILILLVITLVHFINTPTIEDYMHGKVATEVTYTLEDGWLQKCDTIYKYK